MNNRSSLWTKAAVFICVALQIVNAISVALLVVLTFHVIINPDAINNDGGALSVRFLGLDFSLDNMSVYAWPGVNSVPGVVIYLLFGCAQSAMCFLAFGKVRNVIEYAQSQPPFRWENVEKLRQAGLLFLGTVGLELAFALVSMVLSFGAMSFYVNPSLDNLIIGVIILCVSEIFAQSVRMQEDVDGLV